TTFTVDDKAAADNDTKSPQTGDNSHMQYALGTASDAPVSGWSTAVPKAQIAGTYYVWYKVVGGANYKDTTPACVAVKIARAAITVTADNKTKTYGDKDPAFTWRVTVGDFQPNDTLTGIRISRAEGENVGNYTLAVTHTAGTDPNYDITLVNGSLTVVQKEVGIRWDNTALIYNGSAQNPTATATGVVNGDQISFVISGAQTDASDTAYTAAATDLVGAKAGNYKLPTNNTTKFTISKADQATPAGVGKIDETVSKKSDGVITGITAAMEYRKDGESAYISPSESTVANLAAGTYYVRMKGDKNHKPSAEIAVTIAAGRKLNIRVPAQQTGYTLTSSAYAVDYLGGANLTFTLAEGYSKTANFAILLNGNADAAWINDRLSLQGIKDDLNITVDGVADITPPTAEIKVADNAWTSFLNHITFGLFFKETQDVTVTASDNGSGVDKIQYYVGEGQLEYDELRGIADWVDYNGGFALRPDNRYVVYVKVTDKAGNILYISSDGLVFDSVAPVFDGIENGGVYYGDKVIRVFDEHRPVALAVDGADVTDEIADDAYTVAADNQEHTLVATDKAGNVTEYRITVYKNYTVTFKIDGETVGTETVEHGKNATLPPIPEKEGYDQTAPVWDNDGKAITADTEIHAVYTINEYTITFMDENGVYKTLTYKHGETVKMPDVPAKDGYTVRWDAVIREATADATVKAVYTKTPKAEKPTSPYTGTDAVGWMWIMLLFVSGGAVMALRVYGKKSKFGETK
ncbi:MAG: MBG domain-containing protein, partial [Acutalibacteraceae bacterium]